jgi:ABC-2 type transport system ATP-binding protein
MTPAPPPPPVLMVQGLWKRFGDKVAVAGVDLQVPRGAFFGVVGPNGAGKTTTLRMVTGLLRPDAGHVIVDGASVWPDPMTAKSRMGVLPDDLRLLERLTGAEMLTYVGILRGLGRADVDLRVGELLAVLGLDDAPGTLVADYSQGMRKKVALGAALLHRPALLLLDEPFESVDPVSAHLIQAVLRKYVAGGGTVVLSSHVMDTVERLCDGVAIVTDGRVIASGPMDVVRAGRRLEDVFLSAVGGGRDVTLSWLDRP